MTLRGRLLRSASIGGNNDYPVGSIADGYKYALPLAFAAQPLERAAIEHRYATVNGVRMHCAITDGSPRFWYEWKDQLVHFGEDYLAVAPDMRGYNLSSNPAEMAENCRSFFAAAEPFFLYFCAYDPHCGRPFTAWPEPNPSGNRPEGYPAVRTEVYDPRDVIVPPILTDTPECRVDGQH